MNCFILTARSKRNRRNGRNKRLLLWFFLMLLSCLITASCAKKKFILQKEEKLAKENKQEIKQEMKQESKQGITDPKSQTLTVLATTPIIGDLIQQLCGEKCKIKILNEPKHASKREPRYFEMEKGIVEAISKNEVIFYSGLGLEHKKINDTLNKLRESNKKIFAITKNIPKNKLIKVDEKTFNPHFWFSIALWKVAAKYVSDALMSLDRNSAFYYAKQLEKYSLELALLEKDVKKKIAEIAPEKRILITVYDTFAYLGKDYQLKTLSLKESPLDEINWGKISNVAKFIIEREIPAVFLETSTPKKELIPLQRRVFATGNALMIGGRLSADAFTLKKEDNIYIKMFKRNVDQMVFGLNQ